jgi:hypothetical protein
MTATFKEGGCSGVNVIPESVTPQRRSAQAIDSSLLPKNWGEPMGAPAIFEKQNRNQALPLWSHGFR